MLQVRTNENAMKLKSTQRTTPGRRMKQKWNACAERICLYGIECVLWPLRPPQSYYVHVFLFLFHSIFFFRFWALVIIIGVFHMFVVGAAFSVFGPMMFISGFGAERAAYSRTGLSVTIQQAARSNGTVFIVWCEEPAKRIALQWICTLMCVERMCVRDETIRERERRGAHSKHRIGKNYLPLSGFFYTCVYILYYSAVQCMNASAIVKL